MNEKGLDILGIVDDAICDITKRMAGIDLQQTQRNFNESDDVCSMHVSVGGTYQLSLICLADGRLFRAIAERMKRSPVEDEEDMQVYAKEYFNTLCGHIVTRINLKTKSSARFGIPDFQQGAYAVELKGQIVFQVCYQSGEGDVCIQAICERIGSLAESLGSVD